MSLRERTENQTQRTERDIRAGRQLFAYGERQAIRQLRREAVFLAVWLALAVSCECAEQMPTQSPPASAPPRIAASGKPDVYDVDVSGGDIRTVLELLARRSSANIVVSPEVAGEVTAHLKQMPLEAILQQLCAAHGFGFEKTGDTYLITGSNKSEKPPSEAATKVPEPSEVLVWQCRQAKPSDLAALITRLFPSISCAEGPNSITPALDAASSGLGTAGDGSASPSSGSTARSNSSRIVLIGAPADIARARDVLAGLDVPRRQVAIDVAITEISSSGTRDLGIEWTWSDIGLTESSVSGIGFGKFTKEPMTITGALTALIKEGKADLLAQPNVSVLDGECADILIGDRVLYPKLVGYNQIGTPIYDKAEEKVGIYLQISPRIAGEDEIVLTLYPQVSLITGYLRTQAGDYPQISTREARTTVSVKNGSTLAIGGLLRSNEILSTAKVPLLSDLPLVGQLFRHQKRTRDRTEIVILLSPRIVEEK
ncbi:MAG: hypothetical protein ACPL7K_00705 [Armatimonadota bacterium]